MKKKLITTRSNRKFVNGVEQQLLLRATKQALKLKITTLERTFTLGIWNYCMITYRHFLASQKKMKKGMKKKQKKRLASPPPPTLEYYANQSSTLKRICVHITTRYNSALEFNHLNSTERAFLTVRQMFVVNNFLFFPRNKSRDFRLAIEETKKKKNYLIRESLRQAVINGGFEQKLARVRL